MKTYWGNGGTAPKILNFGTAVGYQRFGGPCCLHLRGKVHGAVEVDLDVGAGNRRATVISVSQKEDG
jgi:hypothetical protein